MNLNFLQESVFYGLETQQYKAGNLLVTNRKTVFFFFALMTLCARSRTAQVSNYSKWIDKNEYIPGITSIRRVSLRFLPWPDASKVDHQLSDMAKKFSVVTAEKKSESSLSLYYYVFQVCVCVHASIACVSGGNISKFDATLINENHQSTYTEINYCLTNARASSTTMLFRQDDIQFCLQPTLYCHSDMETVRIGRCFNSLRLF